MSENMPPDLGAAIATEPMWLQAWVMALVASHLLAIVFIVYRESGAWRVHYEPFAIIASFFAASALMGFMYQEFGYVRLLGLAHLVFWTPAYIWILMRRKSIGYASWFGRYIHVYLVIAGISLIIDSVDVIRYLAGDGQLI